MYRGEFLRNCIGSESRRSFINQRCWTRKTSSTTIWKRLKKASTNFTSIKNKVSQSRNVKFDKENQERSIPACSCRNMNKDDMWWGEEDLKLFRDCYVNRMNAIKSGLIVPRSPLPSFNSTRIRFDTFGSIAKGSPVYVCKISADETSCDYQPRQLLAPEPIDDFINDLYWLDNSSNLNSPTHESFDSDQITFIDELSPAWLELLNYDCVNFRTSNCLTAPESHFFNEMFSSSAETESINNSRISEHHQRDASTPIFST